MAREDQYPYLPRWRKTQQEYDQLESTIAEQQSDIDSLSNLLDVANKELLKRAKEIERLKEANTRFKQVMLMMDGHLVEAREAQKAKTLPVEDVTFWHQTMKEYVDPNHDEN